MDDVSIEVPGEISQADALLLAGKLAGIPPHLHGPALVALAAAASRIDGPAFPASLSLSGALALYAENDGATGAAFHDVLCGLAVAIAQAALLRADRCIDIRHERGAEDADEPCDGCAAGLENFPTVADVFRKLADEWDERETLLGKPLLDADAPREQRAQLAAHRAMEALAGVDGADVVAGAESILREQ